MNRGRIIRFGGLFLITLLLFALKIPTVSGDWLRISGEKGFTFDYLEGSEPENLILWGTPGFSFTQSLLLDLEGEFGDYSLRGHLADQPNAPGQLFLEITGENSGLRFGDGSLTPFSSPLTLWNGEFNGAEAYLKNEHHQMKLAYANPTGVAFRESITVRTGRNYAYLTYQPIKEGTLKVYHEGALLIEGVDYQIHLSLGKLELLIFPAQDSILDLEYQFIPGEVLGNSFMAFSERTELGNYSIGVNYFNSQSNIESGPVLLGEMQRPAFFDLVGINLGFEDRDWEWQIEYWDSQEHDNATDWNYIDNMEGDETTVEAFAGSTDPINWVAGSSGSGDLELGRIGPAEDLQHTRAGNPSLVVDYQLQRTGDTVGFYHDFGVERQFDLLSGLSIWVYENGQNLQLEIELITTENNYYFYRTPQPVNGSGWQEIQVQLNELQTIGLPDLSKIRYIRLVIYSPAGDGLTGKLYLAPLHFISKSQAEQRWSKLETSPGGFITVNTDTEANGNHRLKINYNSQINNWVQVTYKPLVLFNISNYKYLKINLEPLDPSEGTIVTISAIRNDKSFQLGAINLQAGRRDYTIPLGNLPQWVLERVEAITLKIDNSNGSDQELRIDDILVSDGKGEDASAIKVFGSYQAGPWRNQVEFSQLQPGFRDLTKTASYETINLRNITEYNDETWRLKTDLQTYRQADLTEGYPLDGKRVEFGVGWGGTNLTISQRNEQVITDEYQELTGMRNESSINLNQQWSEYNFDYKHHSYQNSINEMRIDSGDSFTLKYQKESFWLLTQLWMEKSDLNNLGVETLGKNYALGYEPSGINRFHLNGGVVEAKDNTDYSVHYFWQSDFIYGVNQWLSSNGLVKVSAVPEGNRENITSDRSYDLGMTITPHTALNFMINEKLHDWNEISSGNSIQHIQEYQSSYNWGDEERLNISVKFDNLKTASGTTQGARYAVTTDVFTIDPWFTQVSMEYNTSDGDHLLASSEQASYKYSMKNSLRGEENVFYWGMWAEGMHSDDIWGRRMLQTGWEERRISSWYYGLKIDFGNELLKGEAYFIWGSGGFLTFDKNPHYFQLNLRYQTYTNYLWTASVGYRLLKADLLSVNVHGDYLRDIVVGRNIRFRVDCLFYLH